MGLLRERLPAPHQAAGAKGVVFFYSDISASSVWVAGEFNGWTARQGDRKLVAMRQEGDRWTVTIPYREHVRDPEFDALSDDVFVEHGKRYQYKFVVDTSRWITDPSNPSQVDDGAGNINSLLVAP